MFPPALSRQWPPPSTSAWVSCTASAPSWASPPSWTPSPALSPPWKKRFYFFIFWYIFGPFLYSFETPLWKCTANTPKMRNKYSKKWNYAISTFMYLWAIYIFTWSVRLFCYNKIGQPKGNEAAQFHIWEYINRILFAIAVAVCRPLRYPHRCSSAKSTPTPGYPSKNRTGEMPCGRQAR